MIGKDGQLGLTAVNHVERVHREGQGNVRDQTTRRENSLDAREMMMKDALVTPADNVNLVSISCAHYRLVSCILI